MQTLVTMGFLGIALAAMSLLPGGWSSSPFRESKVARDSQEMPEVIDIPVAADIRTLQVSVLVKLLCPVRPLTTEKHAANSGERPKKK